MRETQDTEDPGRCLDETFLSLHSRSQYSGVSIRLLLSFFSCSCPSDKKITYIENAVRDLRAQLAESRGTVEQRDQTIGSLVAQNTTSGGFIVALARRYSTDVHGP